MSKKIIAFSITYFPFVGGAEIALKEIVKRNNQHSFTLVTAKLDAQLENKEVQDNLTIIRVGQGNKWDKYFFPFRAVKEATKLHKQEKFDLIWGMMANYAGLAAYLFKRRSKLPYLLTLQSGDSDAFIFARTWFWLPLYRQIYRKADLIQAISSSLEKRARKFGYKGDVSIIPNGVDLKKFTKKFSNDEVSFFKQELGLPKNDLILITTSRLVVKNGLEDLIKAVNILNYKYGIPTHLLLLGEGKEESRLKRLIQVQGITDRVHMYGYVDHQHLEKYFAVADVFVRPSLSEGLGNSFLESMAFGVPVIGTPVGGIVDFLYDGETGLFCKPGKAHTIAETAAKYDKDRELYTKISEQGRELVRQKYDWENIASSMSNVFERLTNGQ